LPSLPLDPQSFERLKAAPQAAFPVKVRGQGWMQVRYREKSSGQLANDSDLLATPVRADGTVTLIAPYYPALYTVEWLAGKEWKPLGELECQ